MSKRAGLIQVGDRITLAARRRNSRSIRPSLVSPCKGSGDCSRWLCLTTQLIDLFLNKSILSLRNGGTFSLADAI
jgi:hypothetical protein